MPMFAWTRTLYAWRTHTCPWHLNAQLWSSIALTSLLTFAGHSLPPKKKKISKNCCKELDDNKDSLYDFQFMNQFITFMMKLLKASFTGSIKMHSLYILCLNIYDLHFVTLIISNTKINEFFFNYRKNRQVWVIVILQNSNTQEEFVHCLTDSV